MHSSTTLPITVLLLTLALTSLALKPANGNGCLFKNETGEFLKVASDVLVEAGTDKYVDCVLGENNSYTSNSLNWSSGTTEIIDSRTLRLHIYNASDTETVLRKCVLMPANKGICLIRVNVGTKPKEVENFSCTSVSMQYLDCTWRQPKNIKTAYTLAAILRGNQRTYPCRPTRRGGDIYGCNFTEHSVPSYFKYNVNYTLEMTAENTLGKDSWIYWFNHHSRVWPKAVTKLRAEANSSRTLTVSWDPPQGMEANYVPKLRCRVRYSSQWGNKSDWENVSESSAELTGLHPFTLYHIDVSCISIKAVDENLWSPVATVNVTTYSDVPDGPPEITNGSFFVESSDFSSRNVTLYWKSIIDYHKNGKNFTYHATAHSLEPEDEREPVIEGVEVDQGSARFLNLSAMKDYLFSVYSVNSNGRSEHNSSVVLHAKEEMLNKPESLTVIAMSPNKYNVSWMTPADSIGIEGYTLFYTSTDKLFHKNYKGYLSWVITDTSTQNILIDVPTAYPHHYFAVATYGKTSSSDMLWNTCIVSYNGTVSKLKKIWLSDKSSSSVTIRWSIDCAEKLGIIRGYNVHYCVAESCGTPEKEHRLHVSGANRDSAVIDNLLPFTNYKFAVSVKTMKTDSEISNSILVTTDEAIPTSAAASVQIPEHTNSSFVLKWHPPSIPNGRINRYKITYDSSSGKRQSLTHDVASIGRPSYLLNITDSNENEVMPYTNYTVRLQACTRIGCSIDSEPVFVQTDIGVPGQMEPPQARLMNHTHALIQPEMRDAINGPDLMWDLKLEVVTNENETVDRAVYENLTQTMLYVPFDCEQPEFKDAIVQLRTRAFNLKDGDILYGPWSDYAKMPCSLPMYPVTTIIGIVVGATIALLIIIIASFSLSKKVKIFIEKCKVTVVLPEGLEGADNYSSFNAGMKQRCYMGHSYSKGELICGSSPNSRLLKSESRTRNISNETSQSTISSELLLLHDQRGKSNWADESLASANNDSISSRPSTTQTHLSSDSSIEMTPSIPESPDSVFSEHPLKNPPVGQLVQAAQASSNFNPTLTPIGESQDGGGSSHQSTPQHYSRFASYYDQKDGQNPSSPLTPIQSVDGAMASSYVAAPYSQFGMANDNWSTAPTSSLHNPTWVQGENVPAESHPPSYSKLGLNIPTFDEPLPILKPGAANEGPVTSTPTRSTAGYSVLGMGDEPFDDHPPVSVPGTAPKGYVLAAMLNDMNPMVEHCTEVDELPESDDETLSSTLTPSTSKQDDLGALPSTSDYVNMDSHKRSPSNASSLTAGYCRFGLSRPTSVSSESAHYVAADPTLCPSPVKSGSCRASVELTPSSPYHNIQCSSSDPDSVVDEQQVPSCAPIVHADLHALNGYATVQQMLKSDVNS